MENKLEFFKPMDFDISLNKKDAANIANAKLASALGPKVYLTKNSAGIESWISYIPINETHEAYLFDVKPIVKKCEVHDPVSPLQNSQIAVCKHCKVKLKAIWSECE